MVCKSSKKCDECALIGTCDLGKKLILKDIMNGKRPESVGRYEGQDDEYVWKSA